MPSGIAVRQDFDFRPEGKKIEELSLQQQRIVLKGKTLEELEPEYERLYREKNPISVQKDMLYLDRIEQRLNMKAKEIILLAKQNPLDLTIVEDMLRKASKGERPASAYNIKVTLRALLRRNGFSFLPRSGKFKPNFRPGYDKRMVVTINRLLIQIHHKLATQIEAVTGLRQNDVLGLKWKHIMDDYLTNKEFIAIRYDPKDFERKKAPSYTFIGPSERLLIDQLIKSGYIRTQPEEYIFRPSLVSRRENKRGHMAKTPLNYAITRAKKLGNIPQEIQANHGYRKFYESVLDQIPNSTCSTEQRDMLEGHYSTRRPIAYRPHNWEPLRPIYTLMYPMLDVETTVTALPQQKESDIRLMAQEIAKAMTEKLSERLDKLEAENAHYRKLLPSRSDEPPTNKGAS